MRTLDSYDQVPYESFAIPETHPDSLACLGRLLGIRTAPPEACRVLELGSAAGGNLIPMAFHLPGGTFIGVELGAEQARRGQAMIADLGLANCRLLHQDILEVDEGQAPFDYILVHGVYSWVPEVVREHILRLCGRLLADQGVAFLSYNVLPGWRQRGMLRDMLLHQTSAVTAPAARLEKARELMDLLALGLAGDPRPEAEVLRRELDYLRTARASYLYHEYLEETNVPELFSAFMARARRHGLRYLADAHLHTLFGATLGEAARAVLDRFETQSETEQAMDFLSLRPFRRTLLVRREAEPDPGIDLERLFGFRLFADLDPTEPPALDRIEAQTYASHTGGRFAVSHPLTKALLGRLAALYPNAEPLPVLLEQARDQVQASGGQRHAGETGACLSEVFSLCCSQGLGLSVRDAVWPNQVSGHPRVSDLARAQAAAGEGHTATVRHRSLGLDALSTRLLRLLDGSRDRNQLQADLIRIIESEPDLAPTLRDRIGDPRGLGQAVSANLDRLLDIYARGGLLVA
jgi:hypothetical protein